VNSLGQDDPHAGDGVDAPSVPGALRAAAVASLGAGAIHATAAGAHADPRSAAIAFAATAALQIGWGAFAMVRAGSLASLSGVVINGAALGGWVLAKTSGIGFVDGLDTKESAQFADGLAAGLAAVAVVGALLALARRVSWVARPRPILVGLAAVATLGLAVPGMVSTGNHAHAGGGDHPHGGDEMAGDHGHGDDHGEHAEPKPYDATLPVDLGGTPGVSAEQQAEAEQLVTDTLEELPQFADWTTLEAQGWYSIGDGLTGFEHFINWPLIDEPTMFDPSAPESLVFEIQPDGTKKVVAAMFIAPRDVALEEAPEFGGELVQWHAHTNLCYGGEPNKLTIRAVVEYPGACPGETFRDHVSPMIHVWITPHECGPFASLEGDGGGEVPEGEERSCDHSHGAPTAEQAGANPS
jgi:hypothetical protein